jgi:hypothetical protein
MIAEEDRLRDIVDELEKRTSTLLDAHPPEIRQELFHLIEEDRLPESIANVYAQSAQYEDAADEIGNRIEATIPKTIAGVIALIKFSGVAYDNPCMQNVLTGLREIAAKGGAA